MSEARLLRMPSSGRRHFADRGGEGRRGRRAGLVEEALDTQDDATRGGARLRRRQLRTAMRAACRIAFCRWRSFSPDRFFHRIDGRRCRRQTPVAAHQARRPRHRQFRLSLHDQAREPEERCDRHRRRAEEARLRRHRGFRSRQGGVRRESSRLRRGSSRRRRRPVLLRRARPAGVGPQLSRARRRQADDGLGARRRDGAARSRARDDGAGGADQASSSSTPAATIPWCAILPVPWARARPRLGVGLPPSQRRRHPDQLFDRSRATWPSTARAQLAVLGALVRQLALSSDDLNAILIAVRNDVMRQTDRKQVPWEHSALTAVLFQSRRADHNGGGRHASPTERGRREGMVCDQGNDEHRRARGLRRPLWGYFTRSWRARASRT